MYRPTLRHIRSLTFGALILLALTVVGASARGDTVVSKTGRNLQLSAQGSFYVGGHIESQSLTSSEQTGLLSEPGRIAVDQMYVEYQVPAVQNSPYPIVLVHGNFHTDRLFKTTPDGREGWFTSFARRGFPVYVVNGANSGRVGKVASTGFAVRQGMLPTAALEQGSIITEQLAWIAYRWGPTYSVPYADSQFPIDWIDDYLKQLQPSYDGFSSMQANLAALIDEIGDCILVGVSHGALDAAFAATSSPTRMRNVKAVVSIEGNFGAAGNSPPPALLAQIPFLSIVGDNLASDPYDAFAAQLRGRGGAADSVVLPSLGVTGNGKLMPLEKNNEVIADLIENWLRDAIVETGTH